MSGVIFIESPPKNPCIHKLILWQPGDLEIDSSQDVSHPPRRKDIKTKARRHTTDSTKVALQPWQRVRHGRTVLCLLAAAVQWPTSIIHLGLALMSPPGVHGNHKTRTDLRVNRFERGRVANPAGRKKKSIPGTCSSNPVVCQLRSSTRHINTNKPPLPQPLDTEKVYITTHLVHSLPPAITFFREN